MANCKSLFLVVGLLFLPGSQAQRAGKGSRSNQDLRNAIAETRELLQSLDSDDTTVEKVKGNGVDTEARQLVDRINRPVRRRPAASSACELYMQCSDMLSEKRGNCPSKKVIRFPGAGDSQFDTIESCRNLRLAMSTESEEKGGLFGVGRGSRHNPGDEAYKNCLMKKAERLEPVAKTQPVLGQARTCSSAASAVKREMNKARRYRMVDVVSSSAEIEENPNGGGVEISTSRNPKCSEILRPLSRACNELRTCCPSEPVCRQERRKRMKAKAEVRNAQGRTNAGANNRRDNHRGIFGEEFGVRSDIRQCMAELGGAKVGGTVQGRGRGGRRNQNRNRPRRPQ